MHFLFGLSHVSWCVINVQGGYKGTCWLTSPVAWTTHIPTDAMAQLTYSVVGSLRNTVTDFPKRKLPSSSLTSHFPRHY